VFQDKVFPPLARRPPSLSRGVRRYGETGCTAVHRNAAAWESRNSCALRATSRHPEKMTTAALLRKSHCSSGNSCKKIGVHHRLRPARMFSTQYRTNFRTPTKELLQLLGTTIVPSRQPECQRLTHQESRNMPTTGFPGGIARHRLQSRPFPPTDNSNNNGSRRVRSRWLELNSEERRPAQVVTCRRPPDVLSY